jgi:hypothetical protein
MGREPQGSVTKKKHSLLYSSPPPQSQPFAAAMGWDCGGGLGKS